MTSKSHHAICVVSGFRCAEIAVAMGLRKKLASKVLGQDIDELCLGFYQVGLDQGVNEGVQQAVHDIITDLLSDAVLAVELDTEMMQKIVEIIEG